jgi:spermidine synthase
MAQLLLFSAFVISTCGLVFELVAGTLASYLMGDSVFQFSTIIGVYLFAMGVGSFLSKYLKGNLLQIFVRIEILVGLIGGSSATVLFWLFYRVDHFGSILYFWVFLIGLFVGLEIPLLLQILKEKLEFKDLVSKVFTVDYIGALIASVIFPMLLLPHLGIIRSALFFGIANVLVAIGLMYKLKLNKGNGSQKLFAFSVLALLLVQFAAADLILENSEQGEFQEKIVLTETTPYQRIVLTRSEGDLRLFLNGNLQFSSRDEYRYHEALVHVGLSRVNNPKKILVLGGGDGLAVRELLKYPSIEKITLVDLDPAMTRLFSTNPILTKLNQNSLHSQKLQIHNQDAFQWLRANRELYDFVVIDFPDPGNFSLGKLYSESFYSTLKKSMKPEALAVIQSTSPYVARKAFWCIDETLRSVGFETKPYHVLVPSFGDWGYDLVSMAKIPDEMNLPPNLKFIDQQSTETFFSFPRDMNRVPVGVNRLNNQILVRIFDEEWASYVR